MLTRRHAPAARLAAARAAAGLGEAPPDDDGKAIRQALVATAAISAAGVLVLSLGAIALFAMARRQRGDVGGPPVLLLSPRARVIVPPAPARYRLGPKRGARWWRWR